MITASINPLYAKFVIANIKMYLQFYAILPYWHNTSSWNPSSSKARTKITILHSQYHGCWCAGNPATWQNQQCHCISTERLRECVNIFCVYVFVKQNQVMKMLIICCGNNSSPPGQNGNHFGRRHFRFHFFLMKMIKLPLNFHWNMFAWVQLTISQHWFRHWLGAEQATSHYLNGWWPCSLTHICGTRGRSVNRKWISHDLTEDKSILVYVMAWCHQANSSLTEFSDAKILSLISWPYRVHKICMLTF